VLSKHLTLPLLSTACVALMSPTAISEIPGSDLEKAVDRVGRTARRSVDTHIRNIFSHPRACTTIRRFSALFAFSDNLPAILDKFEHPELTLPSVADSTAGSERMPNKTPTLRFPSISLDHAQSPNPRVKIGSGDAPTIKAITTRQGPGTSILDQTTSGNPTPTPTGATGAEDDDDDDGILVPSRKQQLRKERANSRSTTAAASQSKSASRTSSSPAPSVPGSYAHSSLARRGGGGPSNAPLSDSDDSPPRLSKRAREEAQDRDSDDSDDGAKRGQMKWRGTKQPIKRAGRRF